MEHPDMTPSDGNTETQAPLVNIRYKGKTYTLSAEAADAWNERADEAQRTISRLQTERDRLTNITAITDKSPEQLQAEKDARDVAFWQDPTEAMRKHAEAAVAQKELERRQQESIQRGWDLFYEQHPHLQGKHELVEAVGVKHAGDLGDMDWMDAIPLLGNYVDTYINELKTRTSDPGSEAPTEPVQERTQRGRILSDRQVVSERSSYPSSSATSSASSGRSAPNAKQATQQADPSESISMRIHRENEERRRKAYFNIP